MGRVIDYFSLSLFVENSQKGNEGDTVQGRFQFEVNYGNAVRERIRHALQYEATLVICHEHGVGNSVDSTLASVDVLNRNEGAWGEPF